MPIKLTPRLQTAVGYVRPRHLVADIGTDHAYLPIYLCESGILDAHARPAAIAADINQGPVDRAALHIRSAGLSEAIRTVRTDGLTGLSAFHPEDIIIFGMGGELIVSILTAAPWVREAGHRLILQPMTHAEKVRAYLVEAGFAIIGETISCEEHRIYQTICAEPTVDRPEAYSPAEYMVGKLDRHSADRVQRVALGQLIDKVMLTETAVRRAREEAGRDVSEQDQLLSSLSSMREQVMAAPES